MKRISVFIYIGVASAVLLLPLQVHSQLYINEFLASNTGSTIDPDFNESADWIEIYNAGNVAVNIGGYFLTDNFDTPQKWQIPAGTEVAPEGLILIWADGNDTGLHTNYKISADGEELALFSATGNLIDSISFGLQEPNISMGRKNDGNSEWVFFTQPTPGALNHSESFNGIVHSVPRFSVLGGIFQSPLTLDITNPFGGEIRYTLDGTEPD
ncbi:MAG TPA: lamin tail domain-containing protein, partial [Prolixibacteraceae bacterium]|nr:lamin tail domain-containing protein [Prolixibacteraceae bacterium]